MAGAFVFEFLNETGRVQTAEDWRDPRRTKLWLYNLHYFDDLNAQSATARTAWHRALISRWVTENPPGFGNAWEPYPTSIRIVNWVKWALAGNRLEPEWVQSLAVQTRWLRRRLEWHLLGNHLFANAKALIFAGLFFDGDEAREWLQLGLRILHKEIPEQILADGGHFELSPMYHAIILEDLLDLVNAGGAWPGGLPGKMVEEWFPVASHMMRWLEGLSHPDGDVAFFNDAAFGIAPTHADLKAYANRLNVAAPISIQNSPVSLFPESGYVRLERGDAVALLDVARVGAPYLPGHAHADTLSFELSLFGNRVIVNSGTSQYGLGTERLRQRGTAAHNTLTVNGHDSSEVWSGFRVGRRARPFDLRITDVDETAIVNCSHDGYQKLPGRPVHNREWRLRSNCLCVIDRVSGTFEQAIARFHFHPTVELLPEQALRLPTGECAQWSVDGGTPRIVHTLWHPEFGASQSNRCLEIEYERPEISFTLRWRQI